MVTRGFHRKHERAPSHRSPPGQYVTDEFPVLSARPTPRSPLATWTFALQDVQGHELYRCTWDELLALPATELVVDIHCVTKWSKLDTRWKGVSFDTMLRATRRERRGGAAAGALRVRDHDGDRSALTAKMPQSRRWHAGLCREHHVDATVDAPAAL